MYQAIVVRHLPPTNYRPHRLKAFASAGSITISRDALPADKPECAVAQKLADKYGWKGELVQGGLPNGDSVFVFAKLGGE